MYTNEGGKNDKNGPTGEVVRVSPSYEANWNRHTDGGTEKTTHWVKVTLWLKIQYKLYSEECGSSVNFVNAQ